MGETMKLRHLFFACSGVFVMMFSLLLLVVIVFSDEEDGGSGGNLIYGGVSVSQEVLAHKPMLEKYAREYGIEEYLNVLLAIIQVESGGTLEDVMQSSCSPRNLWGFPQTPLVQRNPSSRAANIFRNCSQRQKQRAVI